MLVRVRRKILATWARRSLVPGGILKLTFMSLLIHYVQRSVKCASCKAIGLPLLCW